MLPIWFSQDFESVQVIVLLRKASWAWSVSLYLHFSQRWALSSSNKRWSAPAHLYTLWYHSLRGLCSLMRFTSQHPLEEVTVYSSCWGVTAKIQRRGDLFQVAEQIRAEKGCESPSPFVDSPALFAQLEHFTSTLGLWELISTLFS